jgi:hypothetical protein
MKKLIQKSAVFAFTAMLIAQALVVLPVQAQSTDAANLFGGTDRADALRAGTYGTDSDPRDIAARVINVLMGFLGIVAVVIILFGGFRWMTAAGNDDKIDEAKKILAAGVIGLIIVLSAWALAMFVMNNILTATSGTTGA